MIQFHSNRSGKLLFYILLFFLSACAQQPRKATTIAIDDPSEQVVHESPSLLAQFFPFLADTEETETFENTADYDNLWARLFSLYALPEINNPRIEYELQRYIKHPGYLEKIQERAEPYLYAIVEEIEAKNMPGELALLPVVESAFRPDAYSRSHAAGIWQFIPATGRFFGLKQNWWYDGRRDIYASTIVATNYLKELHDLFDDDWLLALASYNAGKGTVGKAIEKNRRADKPTDYWSLPLSRETKAYVPRLLAIAKIYANAEKYNIRLRPIANKPVFERVEINNQIDLAKAAQLADVSIERLRQLNPGFHRWSTDPDGPHQLLIPVEKAAVFKQRLAGIPEDEWVTWQRHKVKRGENLSLIAHKYHTAVPAIRQINKLNSTTIRAGQYLLIPVSTKKATYTPEKKFIPLSDTNHKVHTVKRGETFWGIAKKYGVTSKQITLWNKNSANQVLKPGQKLVIKNHTRVALEKSASAAPFQSQHYTVRKGDSLFRISRKFNVSITELRKWNASTLGKHLHPGQKLTIKIAAIQPST